MCYIQITPVSRKNNANAIAAGISLSRKQRSRLCSHMIGLYARARTLAYIAAGQRDKGLERQSVVATVRLLKIREGVQGGVH